MGENIELCVKGAGLSPPEFLDKIRSILDPGDSQNLSDEQVEKVLIEVNLVIAEHRKANKPVSHPLIEAIWAGTKQINSDVALICDDKLRMKLWHIKPLYHIAGTTHRLESTEEATTRVLNGELKKFGITYKELSEPVAVLELPPTDRGNYTVSHLFVKYIDEIPSDDKENWFKWDDIPENTVPTHLNITIPWLIEHGYIRAYSS